MTKQQWRTLLLASRRARNAAERAAARERVAAHLLTALAVPRDPGVPGIDTVCAFHPLPSEPMAADLPERLASVGVRVLVPVARRDLPLDWCEFGGQMSTGPLGIAEPAGPRLGPAAIRDARVVLVPALAVDSRGVRLGRGGGHYDRSLALLTGGASGRAVRPRLIAVVFDDEVVNRLPHDAHDIAVTDVLTPSRGLLPVPPSRMERGGVAQVGRRGASST